MENSKHLINQSVQELQASSTTSPTAAGRTECQDDLADAINQVFALFRINYHNQYHAAFGDTAVLNQAKRLWLSSLRIFTPEQVLNGAKIIIEESEYLPSLHRMISACESSYRQTGLPTPREAYLEACNAPSPKAAFAWTHPAVYHAGRLTGWARLASATEAESYPEFLRRYREQVRLAFAGAELSIEKPSQIAEQEFPPLSKEENLSRVQALKDLLDDK